MQDVQDTSYQTATVRLAALIREPLEGGKDVSQVKLPLRTAIIPASVCPEQHYSQDSAAR